MKNTELTLGPYEKQYRTKRIKKTIPKTNNYDEIRKRIATIKPDLYLFLLLPSNYGIKDQLTKIIDDVHLLEQLLIQ